ncbi:MAG TPA: hypothetical protein VE890_07735 [Thermoguttaceae bacterium]|nr:hypothetical protein [Thermoguttaceae bacterium]
MNPTDQDIYCDDDHRFDLLVDGELSEPQRRKLLAGLDDEPGGWRRCALAFLESQCWRDEFGMMAAESGHKSAPESTTPSPCPARTRQGHLGTLLAMAASFLIALLLGSQLHPWWQGQAVDATPDMQVAESTGNVGEPAPPQAIPETPQRADVPNSPWQMVTFDPGDGPDGPGEPVQLPAIERETVDPQWLQGLPTAMPDRVLQALQQSGHQIRQHREWMPMRMKDGRQLVVPVEQVDVQYVGRPAL